ncbi:MAG TPA: NAD-dependent epimerase/dehydratase family protein [Polyangiaceae bacterium]|nr:NAD-dependent epimerase/dehydratase family protein [Polyangiaceae bacterium]
MKVIITGTTGMVGEGVLLSCLEDRRIERVLTVSRRSSGHEHAKLEELLVPDFRDVASVETKLAGWDACFYCAGISSVGLKEPEYTVITYDTPVAFATTLLRLNPGMTFVHVSGSHTDGTERGKVMWARVKGKAENALMRMPFKGVYNFRPSLMGPVPGQKHLKAGFLIKALYPVAALVFPAMPLRDVARAMVNAVEFGAPKQVLEVRDMKALAARA